MGTYDPLKDDGNYNLDLEKIEGWISNGAQPTDTVKSLIKKAKKAAATAA